MCYAVGSLQQATSTCPMCKVFKPSASRCPHIKDICRNTANHPRHDVMFLKNAEVATFNGCGYCKWAKTNPPPTRAGYQNPGWPGCCRPPNPSEHKYIPAADWPSVSIVHHVPIPPEIKTVLDSVCASGPISPRGTPPLGSPTGSVRAAVVQSAAPTMSRRSSYNVASPTRTETGTTRSNAVAVPTKGRSGGSPQQVTASLATVSRGSGGDGTSSSLPNASSMEQYQSSRRSAMDVFADKRPDPSNTSQNSPGRKHAELSGSVARRSSERRPSISSIAPSVSKATADSIPQRRRTVPTPARRTEVSVERVPIERTPEAPASRRGGSTIEETVDKVEKMSISSGASSGSSGSSSETTVISDGGFTDYLSDESEAELQRQAEAKAAILAQNQMEEQEFKLARQQLAHVDLRPPKSWRGEVQSTPRSQIQTSRNSTSYGPASFVGGPPAYAASAASTHSRG
ncbi:hypothetical protein L226DRAFT_452839 [Lentinus tigrinus ALCF2SS1-7]|uniref:Uncharacterized protein n=1 Tax=Lentinus tigrinus ALCF2SS1-6 TaxID=1328759 RepID=A0A5C2SVC8_9APHY|nr:hypothetical protein L227DRAFT_12211 [Lentinus tigrinus ALCF2SS1-6]RPD80990.1 hypothetical protein L226DRAFT_452839 [Lentinus tigrinus ALCF2SS1-7]